MRREASCNCPTVLQGQSDTGNLEVAATLTPVLLEGKLALPKLLGVNDDFWAIPSIPLFQREVEVLMKAMPGVCVGREHYGAWAAHRSVRQ